MAALRERVKWAIHALRGRWLVGKGFSVLSRRVENAEGCRRKKVTGSGEIEF